MAQHYVKVSLQKFITAIVHRIRSVALKSGFASRYHATLMQHLHQRDICSYRIVDGNYQFVDGKLIGKPSANGMWINGQTQEIDYLRDRNEIVLGAVHIVYYFESHPSLREEETPDPNSSTPRKPYPYKF